METFDLLSRENIIISHNEEYSIAEISLLIAKEFDYENMILFNPDYSDGQYKKTANNTKLISYISKKCPDFIFTNIKDGIKEAVDFFKNNIENCRK